MTYTVHTFLTKESANTVRLKTIKLVITWFHSLANGVFFLRKHVRNWLVTNDSFFIIGTHLKLNIHDVSQTTAGHSLICECVTSVPKTNTVSHLHEMLRQVRASVRLFISL